MPDSVSECSQTLYRYPYEENDNTPGPRVLHVAAPLPRNEGVDAMGRGRQKAKQTKVARELKYYSPETNYAQLERELTGRSTTDTQGRSSGDDPYAPWNWEDDEPDTGEPKTP
jgi:hypothetical protein